MKLVLNRKSDFTNIEYVQFYLKKSGTLPIDIHIALPDDVDVDAILVYHTVRIISVLLRSQSSRFRSFYLHARIHEELERFVSWIGQGIPAPLLGAENSTVHH